MNNEVLLDEMLCLQCGKRIGSNRGSVTSWLFRESRCHCGNSTPVSLTESSIKTELESEETFFCADGFELIETIGQGGMGTVFKARNAEGASVAVKVLKSALLRDKNSLSRFENEAKAAMNLSHANLVKVLSHGLSKDNLPYICMDFVEGKSLNSILAERGKLAVATAVDLFLQLADALVYLHLHDIVHRDLKPSNIIISGDLRATIVDFGIAKCSAPCTSLETVEFTRTGELIGSPAYMSPEQCMGQMLDGRSDIYSLACVIFEVLAGKAPFFGDNPVQIIVKHLHEESPDLRKLNPDVPGDLCRIIKRCLEKDPDLRYKSAAELKEDVLRFKIGKPIARPKLSLRSFCRNHKQILICGFALMVLLALSMNAGSLLETGHAGESGWQKLDLAGQLSFDKGNLSEAMQKFSKALALARSINSTKLIESSLNELIDLNYARGKTAELKSYRSELLGMRKEDPFVKTLPSELESALSSKESPDKSNLRKLCTKANDVGASCAESGDSENAAKLISAAYTLAEKYLPDDPVMIRSMHNQAFVYHMTGKYDEAISGYRAALAKGDKLAGMQESQAQTLLVLARALIQTSAASDEIENLLERCIELSRKNYGPHSPQVARGHYQLAVLYGGRGKIKDAISEIETAVSIYERADKPDKRRLAESYAMLAMLKNSKSYALKSLALYEEEATKDYPGLVDLLVQLARLTVKQDFREASNYIARARAMYQRFPDRDKDYYEAQILDIEALHFWRVADLEMAEKSLRKALLVRNRLYPESALPVLKNNESIAALLLARGNYRAALELYEKMLKQEDTLKETAYGRELLESTRVAYEDVRRKLAETTK